MSNYSKLGQFDSEYAAVLAKLPPPPPPEKERVHSRLREQFDVHFVGKTKDTLRPHLPPGASAALHHILFPDGNGQRMRILWQTAMSSLMTGTYSYAV